MEGEITAIISTVRHGEKDSTGLLTSTGKNQSHKKGINLLHLQGDVILFHSGVQRVMDTILGIAKSIHLNDESEFEQFSEDHDLQSYISPFLHYLYNPAQKGNLFSEWDSIELTKENIHNRISSFLSLQNTSTEPQIYPSPLQMAQRVLKVVNSQIGLASLTYEHARTNFINGTHEPVLMSFLFYILKSTNTVDTISDFLNLIGSSVDYAEGCDIFVYQKQEEITGIQFKFRNIEKNFSLKEWMEISF